MALALSGCMLAHGERTAAPQPVALALPPPSPPPAVPGPLPRLVAPEPAWGTFLVAADGTDLRTLRVRGRPLTLTLGKGQPFGGREAALYARAKGAGAARPGYPLQWVLSDLNTGVVLSQSAGARRNIYGASVAKVFVAAALLTKRGGTLRRGELQLLADMIVASDNTAWRRLQAVAGDGDLATGQRTVQAFMVAHGLGASLGFNGRLGNVQGNALNAVDLVQFLRMTYLRAYPGADLLWRLMHATADVDPKATTYLPGTLRIAGKSGTFGPYHHHVIAFWARGREYGLAVLSEVGSDQALQVLAGGLVRDLLRPVPPGDGAQPAAPPELRPGS